MRIAFRTLACTVGLSAAIGAAGTAQTYTSIFRPAVQLTTTLVNSTSTDYAPALSGDGLTLYWTSSRAAPTSLSSLAGRNVWSVTRPDRASPWTNLAFETSLNSPLNEDYIGIRRDDLEMFISTNRTGGQGLGDIWQFNRTSSSSPWTTATNLTINLSTFEDDPSVTADGLELYWVAPDTSAAAIYWATRPNNASTVWTNMGVVPAAVSTAQDHSASVSPDGLTLIFSSTRTGGLGSSDLWMCTRPSRATTVWTTPVNVQELNTAGWDHNGQFGPDGFTYWYTQNGNGMIWEARRIRPLMLVEGSGVLGVQNGVTGVKLGTTMMLSCRHDPGALGIVFTSLARLPAPLAVPGVVGGLEVNTGTLIFPIAAATGGINNANGRFSLLPIPVPTVPQLAGFSFFAQAGAQSGSLAALSSLVTVQFVP